MRLDLVRKKRVFWRSGGFILLLLMFSATMLVACPCATGAKLETGITISLDPKNPPANSSFTVTGVLSDSTGAKLGNKRVVLEASIDGNQSYPFEKIAWSVTDEKGQYRFFMKNETPPQYIRTKYIGTDLFGVAVSPVVPVHGAESRERSGLPSRATGGLILSGTPDKSLIRLDGEVRGYTPLILSGIEAGPHILTITKPGYQTQTVEIYISQDRQINFDFSLPPAGDSYEYGSMSSKTGLNVYDNTSPPDEREPVGDPIYAWYKPGMSVEVYGNYSSGNATDTTEVTTLYDENPYGDGFSVTVIATGDDTPFR